MRRLAFLTIAFGILCTPIYAGAACQQIPALYANPEPSPGYWGARGGTNRPFVERDGWIRLGYGACDPTPAPTFAPLPNDLVITLILKPEGRKAKDRRSAALIFAPSGQCDQGMANACDLELGGEAVPDGDARCATTLEAKDLEIVAEGKELRLRFPDLELEDVPPKAGAMVIAVTQGTSAPCNLGTETCNAWLARNPATARFCIDEFYDGTCPPKVPHLTFDGLVALPKPNDFHRACYSAPELCADPTDPNLERRLRYTVDHVGNVLVPVLWQDIFPSPMPSSTAPPPMRQVRGDAVLPYPFKLPNGDRRFIESYTAEGKRLQPTNYGEAPNSLSKVTALMGTTDGYYSVLRLRSGVCEGGGSNDGERCRKKHDCPGGTCRALLPDLGKQIPDGVGKVARSGQEVCEEIPQVSCNATSPCPSGAGRCVGYSLTAYPAPTPSPMPSPSPLPLGASLVPLLPADADILDVAEDDTKTPPEWLAAIVKFKTLIEGLPDSAAGKRVVVVARIRDLAPQGRKALQPVLGPGRHPQTALRITQHGAQTRLISDEPPDLSVKDEERAAEGTPDDRFLKVYDAERAKLVTVALVDPNDRERDPLREHPNGSTSFVSPSGQCVTTDGLVLPVPSQCRPRGTGDCPRGSACRATRIVVAVDLRTDSDGNGVPDVLEGVRTPETRH